MCPKNSIFTRTIALVTLWVFLCSNVSFALRPPAFKDRSAAPGIINGEHVFDPTNLRFGFENPEKAFTDVVVTYRIGPWVKKSKMWGNDVIPDFIVEAVKAKLNEAVKDGKLKTARVYDRGATDLDINVTHNYGLYNVSVSQLIYEAVINALRLTQEKGFYAPYDGKDILALPYREQMHLLQTTSVERCLKERPAEPVVIAKGVNVSMGAANIILYRQFAIPGATPLQKLGLPSAPGFRFVVRRTEDIISGKENPDEFEFIIATTTSEDKKKKMEGSKTEQNDAIRLLTLLSQPNDFQIVAVYPVKGGALPADEPLAVVQYAPAVADGTTKSLNPTILFRSQNGADAVGGITNMVFTPNYVPGGPNGSYFVATAPVTLNQARMAPRKPGLGYFVVYGGQSSHDGELPDEEILDHVALNPAAYRPHREMAEYLADVMASQGDTQPFLSPQEAELRTRGLRHEQNSLFTLAPSETEIDPFLEPLQRRIENEGWFVFGDDKADMGGMWGHNKVHPLMAAIYMASLKEAVENGEILWGNIWREQVGDKRVTYKENGGVGDDGQLLQSGRDIYGTAMHQISFRAFTRAYYFFQTLGIKLYGLGQDFQGPEAKEAMKHPEEYSKLSPRFFEILKQFIPKEMIEKDSIGQVMAAWQKWQESGQGVALEKPFSGNVTQQGIGSARYALNPKAERTFDIIGGDKMGPPALNRLIMESAFNAVDAEEFENGLVLEIWDLKPHGEEIPLGTDIAKNPSARIFLDVEKDRDAIRTYLAHSDRYNVRNVWSKKRKGFDITNPGDYLDRPLLSSTVTRLGILADGAYVGKDDPVIIGNTKLMEYLHEFLRTHILIGQGDMNGSHWEPLVVTAFKYANANARSHPILTAARFTISEDGAIIGQEDLYKGSKYNKIKREAHEFAHIFDQGQLGQFEPHGTNWRTCEPSYPLAKMLAEITAPDSPYRVTNQKDANGNLRQPAVNITKEVYGALGHMLAITSKPEGRGSAPAAAAPQSVAPAAGGAIAAVKAALGAV